MTHWQDQVERIRLEPPLGPDERALATERRHGAGLVEDEKGSGE